MSDYWAEDGHSHSWFTVQELLDYDWTQTTTLFGVLSAEFFYEWNGKRQPDKFSGEIYGPDIKHVSVEEMRSLIKTVTGGDKFRSVDKVKDKLKNYYCQVSWVESYHQATSDFWSEAMPKLLHVGKPEEVRIVFWFDN